MLTQFFTWRKGVKVGQDAGGNTYYRTSDDQRRWVIFNGDNEASRVSPDWHGWLHHTESTPPPAGGYDKHVWQLEHQPNVTGTNHAYRPDGHMLKGGKRKPATGDYEPWNPA